MNSKFKRTRIAALLLIAGSTASTVCAQSYTPASGPQYGAPQNGRLKSDGNLPPIVSGAQHQVQPIVRNAQGNLPPIVSGSQNRQQPIRQSPPIVQAQSITRQNSNQSGQSPSLDQNAQNGFRPAASGLANPLRPIQVPQIIDNQTQRRNGQGNASAQLTKPLVAPSALPQAANRLEAGQVLSASGVPFYSSNEPNSVPRMRVEQPNFPGNFYRQSEVQDGSNGSVLDSSASAQAAQQPAARQPSAQQPRTRDGMSSVMAPRNGQDTLLPGEGSNAVIDPAMNSRGSMDSGSVAQNYFEMDPSQTAFTPGCQDCVAAGGFSNCPTCSPNSTYATGVNGIDSTSGYFGAMSRARRYAEIDLLYLTRNDGSIVFSNFGGLGNFDGNAGLRFTLGQRSDETQGKEFSYFGTSDLSAEVNRVDPGSRLNALFSTAGVIDASLTQPFFNARIQNEQMQTRVHSIEFNRVKWAWDVVKSFVGFRYIYVDDSYSMFSQRGVNTADYQIESLNNMVGVHIGREIFYDIGYRISFSALGKGGIYANGNRFNVNVANNGVPFIDNRNDSSAFSTSLELMLTGHYQINRRSRLRMGYQAMLLDNVYSISDNLTGTLSPFFGTREADKDSMFFHGINVGLEFYR